MCPAGPARTMAVLAVLATLPVWWPVAGAAGPAACRDLPCLARSGAVTVAYRERGAARFGPLEWRTVWPFPRFIPADPAFAAAAVHLGHALFSRDAEAVERLLGRYPDLLLSGVEYVPSPLHQAAKVTSGATLAWLLARGAYANSRDSEGRTPLEILVASPGCEDCEACARAAAVLLAFGADASSPGRHRSTPLHHAATRGCTGLAAELLSHGADPNARDHRGETPTHAAARWTHRVRGKGVEVRAFSNDILGRLVAADADLEAVADNGETPLCAAVSGANAEGAILLLSANAGLTTPCTELGELPLARAAGWPLVEVVERILEQPVDVNARDQIQYTALLVALQDAAATKVCRPGVRHRSPRVTCGAYRHVVELLLRHGARTDLASDFGTTPLHAAVFTGDCELVANLVGHGASLDATDERGCTALDAALQAGDTAIADLLRATIPPFECRLDPPRGRFDCGRIP